MSIIYRGIHVDNYSLTHTYLLTYSYSLTHFLHSGSNMSQAQRDTVFSQVARDHVFYETRMPAHCKKCAALFDGVISKVKGRNSYKGRCKRCSTAHYFQLPNLKVQDLKFTKNLTLFNK